MFALVVPLSQRIRLQPHASCREAIQPSTLPRMGSNITSEVAKRIRQARERAGLTQAQLAEAAGLSDESVSRIERGTYEPALSSMVAMAEVLGVGLDSLCGLGGGRVRRRSVAAPPVNRRLQERAALVDARTARVLLKLIDLLPSRRSARRT